jgi:hypothetical protein
MSFQQPRPSPVCTPDLKVVETQTVKTKKWGYPLNAEEPRVKLSVQHRFDVHFQEALEFCA